MSSPPLSGYAGFWRRAGALAIDEMILAVPAISLAAQGVDIPFLEIFISVIAGWIYYSAMHSSGWQATLGKKAFHIKVTSLAGERISFGRATARYFATIISTFTLFIGYVMAAFTERRQALHDKIAGTLVVDAGAGPQAMPVARTVMPLPFRTLTAIIVLNVAWPTLLVGWTLFSDTILGLNEKVAESSVPGIDGPHEEISYAIYDVPLFSGEPRLVKGGTRKYAHSEVVTRAGPAPGIIDEDKILAIADGFEITAALGREERIDGFGLTLSKRGQGFSWEWFDRESGDIFRKRQGGGQVQARFKQVDGKEELAEIFFLDDITMRLDRYWFIPLRNRESDLLVVRKGSVLWLSD